MSLVILPCPVCGWESFDHPHEKEECKRNNEQNRIDFEIRAKSNEEWQKKLKNLDEKGLPRPKIVNLPAGRVTTPSIWVSPEEED